MNSTFYDLPDDVLIHTIAFLSAPDILLLRQVRVSKSTIPVAKSHKHVNGFTRSQGYGLSEQMHSSSTSSQTTILSPSMALISSIARVTHTGSRPVGSQTPLTPKRETSFTNACFPNQIRTRTTAQMGANHIQSDLGPS